MEVEPPVGQSGRPTRDPFWNPSRRGISHGQRLSVGRAASTGRLEAAKHTAQHRRWQWEQETTANLWWFVRQLPKWPEREKAQRSGTPKSGQQVELPDLEVLAQALLGRPKPKSKALSRCGT